MDPSFPPLAPQTRRLAKALAGFGLFCIACLAALYLFFIAAPERNTPTENFIVPLGTPAATAVGNLETKGFVKDTSAFRLALELHGKFTIAPGGYAISKSMNAWKIAGILAAPPAMEWVTIPEGLRKEEIADIFAEKLGWSADIRQRWITVDTVPDADHAEGVYYPDTYLIPKDDAPAALADRMRKRFDEKFAPYAAEAAAQKVSWTTALKLASLIQREAAGTDDMPLISGILWNRLNQNMPLQIDATLQYAKGTEGNWWPKLASADKAVDSPFNTYKNRGLPPRPITNPGEDALKAALRPRATKCLYYIHDPASAIHCATTYTEHLKNIDKYLK